MTQAQLPYVLLYLGSTFLASVSQVLLKKAAMREHKSLLAEYTDWRVILGYGLFVGCTLLTMLAYRGVPLNVGPVLEATGYLYVTIFGVTIFHERMNPKKIGALALILLGIVVYAL
ncbi:MAG: multidrug ABC transporter [Subdoligranulum variabile]|nr:MAG: multidrug ABC transporter [Subdoligranulum variabile]